MRLFRSLAAGLAWVALLPAAAPADSAAPASPVRLIPAQADLLVEVRQPRLLIETLTTLDTVKQLQAFPAVKEQLGSTNVRRFYQLVAYFEKELGAPWPELLDRLAGGGAALGVKFGPNPAPSLLVVRGKDEKLMQQFFRVGLSLVEQELARQEAKGRPVKGSYQGVETVRVGKEFYLALAGTALLIANQEVALHGGLDLYLGRQTKGLADLPPVAEAGRLLPKDALVSVWLNMEAVRQAPGAKELYKSPRDNGQLTVLLGTLLDVLGRTPFVCAGLYRQPEGFLTTIRIPRGREGMGPDGPLHLAPPGQPGTRPLLEPRGVLYSQSFYLDQGRIWLDRAKLFPDKQVQALEGFDKNSGRFLAGARLSQLLTEAGPYHRLVVVDQPKAGYKTTPKQPIPAFALVTELRKPESFGKAMESVLRGAALLATTQVKLKMVEEEHGGCKIVAYRFSEEAPLKADVSDVRFNFSPCFTRVGDQFVLCSTVELCRELIDVLSREDKSPTRGAPFTERTRVYGGGVATLLQGFEDQLVTQTILDQAVPPGEARAQVKAFIALVSRLGDLNLETSYLDKEFRYEIRMTAGK
jgi:hypothetical protein